MFGKKKIKSAKYVKQLSKTISLYIHIPFCKSKCAYCDFYSVKCNSKVISDYLTALEKQMQEYSFMVSSYNIESVYIGGGTPTSLSDKDLKRLFASIDKNFNIPKGVEYTVEANPGVTTKKKLKILKKNGVNRLSIGIQSANDKELAVLSRIHTYSEAETLVNLAKKLKFNNVSVDIMFGLPYQTPEIFADTLEKVTELPVNHISCYGLKIEENTPFADKKRDLNLPDEETERKMYFDAIEFLQNKGFMQYEISNFAKEGYYSRHNQRYWDCKEYLGLGASASSYFGGKRFTFVNNIDAFCKGLETDVSVVNEIFEIPEKEQVGEFIMLALRCNKGINKREFLSRFHKNIDVIIEDKAKKYIEQGLIMETEETLALTPEGFYVSNSIIGDFLDY